MQSRARQPSTDGGWRSVAPMSGPEDRPVLPDRTTDEEAATWGDYAEHADDPEAGDTRRLVEDKPPHHVD